MRRDQHSLRLPNIKTAVIAAVGNIVQLVCMVVATACHVDGYAPAYWPCTASRVRSAGPRCAHPALDPVPSLVVPAHRAMQGTDESGIHSVSRHSSRSQLSTQNGIGPTFAVANSLEETGYAQSLSLRINPATNTHCKVTTIGSSKFRLISTE